ncbi:MAG: sulfotransferase domain-containing protein, partial [Proteobacteria bacterium]|nr:sulfotransferase domain-containing protein [Pseudomonadota bacterium]
PYYAEVKYIIVGRDPRDVFMSFVNHYANYTDLTYGALDFKNPGPDIPRYTDDIKTTWRNWISKGWFEWEQEGYPFWSNMHHTQTYWEFKSLPNFLFLHYADMLKDTPAAVRKIADFIDFDISEDKVDAVVEATLFDNVRTKALTLTEKEDVKNRFFAGGTASFFFKGSNGRWKEVLDETDLAMYEDTKARVLSADCADWLENGGSVL